MQFWEVLHQLLQDEPPFDEYRAFYGELAELGIAKGVPARRTGRPDARHPHPGRPVRSRPAVRPVVRRPPPRTGGLGRHPVGVGSAPTGERHVRHPEVPRRLRPPEVVLPGPDRVTGDVRRSPGAGSCIGSAPATPPVPISTAPAPTPSRCLNRSRPSCSGPSPSTTPTRSEIATDQSLAAIRSMFELADLPTDRPSAALRTRTTTHRRHPPMDQDQARHRMVRLLPHLRPERPTFDGTWRLPDFQPDN